MGPQDVSVNDLASKIIKAASEKLNGTTSINELEVLARVAVSLKMHFPQTTEVK